MILAATPIDRLGDPNDIARSIAFNFEGASRITGERIAVSGEWDESEEEKENSKRVKRLSVGIKICH